MPVDLFLLTRFNLPSKGVESTIRSQEGWLKRRVSLFERYCVPSVRQQTVEGVHWLVYFDPESPAWLKDWITRTSPALFTPQFRSEVSTAELTGDMSDLVSQRAPHLITVNLDNDDGLAFDFLERLRCLQTPGQSTAVYLANGLIRGPEGLYLRTDRENAFCAVKETWENPRTCWADWHNRLSHHMPVTVVEGEPAWLQVVHGTNVSNRVRGRLVSPSQYKGRFAGIEDVPEPSITRIWSDHILRMPMRSVRSSVRTAARRAAVAALGKEGLNTLKVRFVDLRHSSESVRTGKARRKRDRGVLDEGAHQ